MGSAMRVSLVACGPDQQHLRAYAEAHSERDKVGKKEASFSMSNVSSPHGTSAGKSRRQPRILCCQGREPTAG